MAVDGHQSAHSVMIAEPELVVDAIVELAGV
jgi:hypothetical protein